MCQCQLFLLLPFPFPSPSLCSCTRSIISIPSVAQLSPSFFCRFFFGGEKQKKRLNRSRLVLFKMKKKSLSTSSFSPLPPIALPSGLRLDRPASGCQHLVFISIVSHKLMFLYLPFSLFETIIFPFACFIQHIILQNKTKNWQKSNRKSVVVEWKSFTPSSPFKPLWSRTHRK